MSDLVPQQPVDPLLGDPEQIIPVQYDMAEIVESDRPGFIAFNNPTWSPDSLEYLPLSELPEGMDELAVGAWVSMRSHRKVVTEALVKVESFESIEAPIYTVEEREAFWNGKEIGGREDI